jgi:hypothetical protein
MAHDPNDPRQAAEYEDFMKRVAETRRARIELDGDGLAVFNDKGELESFRSAGGPIGESGRQNSMDDSQQPGMVEVDAQRGTVYLFHWETNDFTLCQVHVSCPKCFTLSKHSLDLFKSRLQCPACPFSGPIAYDAAGLIGYEEWKKLDRQVKPEEQAIAELPNPILPRIRERTIARLKECAAALNHDPRMRIYITFEDMGIPGLFELTLDPPQVSGGHPTHDSDIREAILQGMIHFAGMRLPNVSGYMGPPIGKVPERDQLEFEDAECPYKRTPLSEMKQVYEDMKREDDVQKHPDVRMRGMYGNDERARRIERLEKQLAVCRQAFESIVMRWEAVEKVGGYVGAIMAAEAYEDARKARAKLLELEAWPNDIAKGPLTININGRHVTLPPGERELSYRAIAGLVYMVNHGGITIPDTLPLYTVTYRDARPIGSEWWRDGCLPPGQAIEVHEGTIINAYVTGAA